MTTRRADAPAADAPARFGAHLLALFASAGSPTLASTVSGAARLSPGRAEVTVQRLSDWRRGRHLPASFETLEPVLAWLILQAQSKGADAPGLAEWQRWWSAARSTRATDRTPQPAPDIPTPVLPYRGLDVMTAADSAVFFGRERVLDELVGLVDAAAAHADRTPAVVIVTGVSGAGKSSLLRAGIARIAARPEHRWSVRVRLAIALTDEADETGRSDAGAGTPDGEEPDTGHADADRLTIHVVDQIEQVLVGESRHSTRVQRLIDALTELASTPGHVVVVGARADMYERCSTIEPLATAWQRRSIVVPPLTDKELEEVIAGPARLSGIRVDKGLAPTILSDLRGLGGLGGQRGPVEDRAGQLPLVAHVLAEMWSARGGGMLTVAGYHAAGGVASAISDTAEKTWQAFDPAQQRIAERLLRSLIHISDGVTARRPRTLAELTAGETDRAATVAVIEALAESRLITVSDQQVQIIHDVVLTAWPRLDDLIERTREIAPVLERVDADAAEWDRQGRETSLLYNPNRYAWASPVLDDPIAPTLTRDYLAASRRNIDSQRRRRRWGIAAVALLAVISVVAAIIAIVSNAALARESNDAKFSALLSTAGRLAQTDPGLAAHLAVGAWRIRPDDPLAQMRVLQTQQLPLPSPAQAAHAGSIYDMMANPSKSLLATASYDKTVRLWAAGDPSRISAASPPMGGYSSFVTSVDFAPQGDRLASADGDGHITVWDIGDVARPRRISELDSPFGSGTSYILRYNRAGTLLATTHDNGVVTLWDTTAPGGYRAISAVRGFDGPVRTVAISDVAPIMVVGSDDGTIGVVDISNPSTPELIARIRDGVDSGWHSVAVSPDGRLVAAGRDDGEVAIWSIANPRAPAELRRVRAHDAAIWSVSFADDGRSLVSAGLDGTAKRWDVSTDGNAGSPNLLTALGVPMRTTGGAFFTALELRPHVVLTAGGAGTVQSWDIPSSPTPAHTLPITRTSVSADGKILATSGADQKVLLWDLSTGTPTELSQIRRPLRPSGGYVAAFNRTGTVLATAFTNGGEVELYDISDPRSPQQTATLRLDTRHAFPLAFSPSTGMLVTGSDDNSLQLWDVSNPRAPTEIGPPVAAAEGFVEDVDFSPDGSSLAVADARHRITRWHVSDPDNPTEVQVVTSPQGAVNAVEFSPDGKYLYAGDDDQKISVIDVGSSSMARVSVPAGVRVSSLSIASDGKTLVVGGTQTIQLWNISDPVAPTPIAPDESITSESVYVREPTIDPQNTIYAGGSSDLQWWTIDVEAVADRVCTAEGGIDRQTWDAFAEGVDYVDVCPGS
ncbi:nSTAND1 domain-containing NTPase [Gordonia sp. NPDC003504]